MLMMNEGNSLRRIFIISQIGVTLLLGIFASIFLSQKDWSVYSRHKSVCVLIVKTLTIELVKGNLNFIKFEWLGNVLLGLSAAVVGHESLFRPFYERDGNELEIGTFSLLTSFSYDLRVG